MLMALVGENRDGDRATHAAANLKCLSQAPSVARVSSRRRSDASRASTPSARAKLCRHLASATLARSDLIPEKIDHASACRRSAWRANRPAPRRLSRAVPIDAVRTADASSAPSHENAALPSRFCSAARRSRANRRRRSLVADQLPAFPVPGRARDLNRLAEFAGQGSPDGISAWPSFCAIALRKRRDQPAAHFGSQNLGMRAECVFDRLLPAPISRQIASEKNR